MRGLLLLFLLVLVLRSWYVHALHVGLDLLFTVPALQVMPSFRTSLSTCFAGDMVVDGLTVLVWGLTVCLCCSAWPDSPKRRPAFRVDWCVACGDMRTFLPLHLAQLTVCSCASQACCDSMLGMAVHWCACSAGV